MIRRCDTGDQPEWLAMRQALWPEVNRETHQAEMNAWCEDSNLCAAFVAEAEDGTVIGFVEASIRTDDVPGTSTSPVGYLEGLYVVPSCRRSGTARALVTAAERWAFSLGCREMASDVELHNNVSQSTHTALGYCETERVVFYRKALR